MQSEKQKRSLMLLDDGELPDHYVDPNLGLQVLAGHATKTKRRINNANRPGLRVIFIRLGGLTVSYIVLYALGNLGRGYSDLAGLIPFAWGAVAFLSMPVTVGRYLLGRYESWEANSDPREMNAIGQGLVLSLLYLVIMAAWVFIVVSAFVILAFNQGGGVGE